ncbi:MAG: GldG family protein [Clostridia bacterium]|nr:GldG family protein [Clostridia bacterium]
MENNNQNLEIIETSETVEETTKENKFKKLLSSIASFFKKFKSGKIKNEALLRRGGYSLAITAIVLAGVIVFNWLVASLGDRFNLEFDMTADKKNSISEENVEYIKNLDADVNITICGNEDEYAEYMTYYAQNYYGVTISSSSETEYFSQTVNLIDKYTDFNDRITVKYVDPQSTEFTAITTTYSSYKLAYGDMIVTSSAGGKERIKVLSFDDIYVISTSGSNSYYQSYTLAANKLESALTSAIAYVTSADSKKVAVLSGHSQNNYTDAYAELLDANNYDITNISDKLITTISSEYDAIIISAPSIDFIGSELDVISNFLENDGKKGKGLIFFADATCPALPNFYAFLKQWGIEISEGILFETDPNYQSPDQPSTMIIQPATVEDEDILENLNIAVANYTVPMKVCEDSSLQITATALMQTFESAVVAPIGASKTWAEYTDADKKQFDCVIQSVDSDFDSENNAITSYIMAFASVEFVQSEWASYEALSNQDIVMACTDRAAHVGDTSMTFTSKVITNESFATKVNASNTKLVAVVFMLIIPVVIIAAGIVVFVRRRNAR